MPPGVFRSFSTNVDPQQIHQQQQQFEQQQYSYELEKFEKTSLSTSLSLETAKNLILLLEPTNNKNIGAISRNNFSFSHSVRMWSLCVKSILKVKVSLLIEAKVFDHLVSAFLSASQEIQQTMFPEILLLTQNMVNQGNYQKEFCNAVLNVLFSTIHKAIISNSYDIITFNLLKGWLDILLTKTTPKPEEYYTKPFSKAFCKLNATGAKNLLLNVSTYLKNYLNLGGKEGAEIASELTILKLNLADDMIKLLIHSESTSNILAISELFANIKKYKEDIKFCMANFIEWYLLNKNFDSKNSPSTELMKSISESVFKLFSIATEHDEVIKQCLSSLIDSCKILDVSILKFYKSSQLFSYSAVNFNTRCCKILEELFDLWVTSDSLASHISFEVKGFEYLLDRMGITDSLTSINEEEEKNSSTGIISNINETQKNSLLSGTDLLDYIQSSIKATPNFLKMTGDEKNNVFGFTGIGGPSSIAATNNTVSLAATTNTSAANTQVNLVVDIPPEEEFANKIIIINQPGQHLTNISTDWSSNRKGARTRILFFQMNNQFYSEYHLVLQLDKVVEMKQIKIGFNTVWTDFSDKVLGLPSSVLIEGGTNLNSLVPLGTLEPINDEGYSNFSVKVFRKNFQMINTSGGQISLEESLKSLVCRKVKFIKLRFRRPVVTFVEGLSMLSNKTYKNVAVSISFLSISGYDTAKIPSNMRSRLLNAQKTSALHVIGKLCNPLYVETLRTLANKKDVIEKIKMSFEALSAILVQQENWLSPVFLAIASYNQEMGYWIINKFLDLNKSQAHAKMVLEIILSSSEYSHQRLQNLYNFILKQIQIISMQPNRSDAIQKYGSLIFFINSFFLGMRLSNYELLDKGHHEEEKQQNQLQVSKKIVFKCSMAEIESIIQAFDHQHNNLQVSKALIKLIVTLLYLPLPFVSEDDQTLVKVLDLIWSKTIDKQDGSLLYNKTYFYEMLAPLLSGCEEGSRWLLKDQGNKLKILFTQLENKIDSLESRQETLKSIRFFFLVINSASCRDEEVKKYIIAQEYYLKIYKKLKSDNVNNSFSILKDIIDKEILGMVVEFIKNTILGYVKAEEKLALTLKEDLSLLEKKRDMNFVTNLLVPLLNSEADIPVCLHPYDSHNKRWLTEGRRMERIVKKKENIDTFNPKCLSNKQKSSFLDTLKKFTQSTGLSNKIAKSQWQFVVAQTMDGQNTISSTIHSKVLQQAPFLILIEGTNSEKNCICGIFSSQAVCDTASESYTCEEVFQIPHSEDSFFFYYEDDFSMHFNVPTQNYFGHYHEFDEGNGISFYYNGSERIFISQQSSNTTYVDINLYDMKPFDEDQTNFPLDIPADFVFKKAEYWVLKPMQQQQQQQPQTNLDKLGTFKNESNYLNVIYDSWYNPNNPLNSYRSSPILNVPANLTVKKMTEHLFSNSIQLTIHSTKEVLKEETNISDIWQFVLQDPTSNRVIDIDFDIYNLIEESQKDGSNKGANVKQLPAIEGIKGGCYVPMLNIFTSFEKCGGVQQIIDVILKSLSLWKNKDRAAKWFVWVKELSSFSNLPHFFGLFIKNKECVELLFQILAGVPDEEVVKNLKGVALKESKKWEEEENKAVKFSYQILADVFRVDNDSKIRDFALENQFIERILDRLKIISKEEGRKYVANIEKENVVSEKIDELEKKPKEEDYKKKIVKKKGVGYASDNTGQNQKWNINEYHETKKQKNEQLKSLLTIFETFLDFKNWKVPQKLMELICSSALLPLLESAFRSGSLLEVSKEADLFFTYLSLKKKKKKF